MNKSTQGHLALIVAGILFGANYWIAKSALDAFHPYEIVAYRIFFATLIFWIIDILFPSPVKLNKKDFFTIFFAGLLGVAINQTMFFIGLKNSTPVETSILHTLSPLIVALMAVWLINEKLTTRKITGIFFGFIGCLIIVISGKQLSFSNSHLLGNLFIVINIVSYSIFLVIIKPIMQKYSSIYVLKYVFLFGLICFLPVGIMHFQNYTSAQLSVNAWLSLIYVILGTTIITYFLTIYAIKKLPATTVGFYIYLQPFIAASIGYITGKEKLTFLTSVASVSLFLGVWLVLTEQDITKKLMRKK